MEFTAEHRSGCARFDREETKWGPRAAEQIFCFQQAPFCFLGASIRVCPVWPGRNKMGAPSRRANLLLPTSPILFLRRSIDPGVPGLAGKKQNGGPEPPSKSFASNKPHFVS